MSSYYGVSIRRGVAAPTLNLISTGYADDVFDPFNANCALTLYSTGALIATGTGGGSYYWLTGGNAADYEVRATLTSGTFSSGTTGTWLSLASNQTWSVSRASMGVKSATATFEIRSASSGTVLKSASIILEAIVE